MADGDYGIAIGIDRYPALDRPLRGAVSDAEAFRDWLLGPAGVPAEQVALVTSPRRGRARPVQDEIDEWFDTLLDTAARRGGRRLYVYFAGHGYSTGHDHVNLLLANATERLLNRGLNASEYQAALRAGPFEEEV